MSKTPSAKQVAHWARLREIGAKGGRSTSAAKAAAVARNGGKPCRPGRVRGWPKGKPRGRCTICGTKGNYYRPNRNLRIWQCGVCENPASVKGGE